MGESAAARPTEVQAVRLALELGYRLIDTAEMYADGGAETVVGEALRGWTAAAAGRREDVVVVSKVLPSNASRKGVVAACERSLRRLQCDCIDVYLLHWRGAHPLAETVAGFESLRERGLIRAWGVSNFDVGDLADLAGVEDGAHCVTNQVYYSASERGIEFDLLPAQRKRRLATMAYCPVDQGALAADATFAAVGARHGATAAQAALAWVLRQPDVVAIPKAVRASHLRDNLAAADIALDAEDLAEIDRRHPPPRRKRRLAVV